MPELINVGSYPTIQKHVLSIKDMRGADYTSSIASTKRARYALNMTSDTPGSVRKRMGYHRLQTYGMRINGIHFLGDELIVHSGTRLYIDQTILYDGMADEKSWSLRFNRKLYLWDGKNYLQCSKTDDGYEVVTVQSVAYVPQVTISRAPNGGGESFDAVNMLSDARTDSFLTTADATVYQLSSSGLNSTKVTAQVKDKDGNWVDKVENTDFTVDRTTGTVTFSKAPGLSPIEGEDSLRITYSITNEDYKNRVNSCRFSIAYGVSAAADRVFMSGSADYPNYAFFSQINDPTYMGDLWYCVLGQPHSPITGFSIISDQLAVHKRDDDDARNIWLMYGTLDEDADPKFTITGSIQGKGAITPFAFGYVKEPIFLTGLGVYATTPLEYNDERYVQDRGYFISDPLLKEVNLSSAHACVYKDLYLLAINGKVYALDSLVPTQDKTVRSNYYYEAFLWDNIPARVISSKNDRLIFGDATGYVYEFYTDPDALTSYNDNGVAIKARWDIDFSGDSFYLKKRLRYVAVRLAAGQTSCVVKCRVRGVWNEIAKADTKLQYFSFTNLNLASGKFTLSGDTNPRTFGKKIKVKKVDFVRLSFQNENINEPFGIYDISLEFSESGYYKR